MNLPAIFALSQPPVRKSVLIAMAHHAGPGGWVTVTHETLARETGFSVPSVRNAVHALLGLGYVVLSPIEAPLGVALTYRVDPRFVGDAVDA